jgi:hypothetical protein
LSDRPGLADREQHPLPDNEQRQVLVPALPFPFRLVAVRRVGRIAGRRLERRPPFPPRYPFLEVGVEALHVSLAEGETVDQDRSDDELVRGELARTKVVEDAEGQDEQVVEHDERQEDEAPPVRPEPVA